MLNTTDDVVIAYREGLLSREEARKLLGLDEPLDGKGIRTDV